MSEKKFFALFDQLWLDFQQPGFVWEALALLVLLLCAWDFSRRVIKHEQKKNASAKANGEHSALRLFGAGSLKRVLFPVLALLGLLVLRLVVKTSDLGQHGLLDIAVPLLISMALVNGTIYVLRSVFAPSGWLAASERLIAALVWIALAMYITGLSTPVIAALESVSFTVSKQHLNLWMLIEGTLPIGVVILSSLWLSGVAERRLMAEKKLDTNLRVVFSRLTKAVLVFIASLISLSFLGIDGTALSLTGGALAIGLGFGMQKIASNYVSGFIILLDRSIRIGNLIAIDDAISGTVTQITTRYTVMRTLTGAEVIVPNEHLVSNIVRNLSFTDSKVRLTVSVQVAYSTDLDQAMALMLDAARQHERVLADPEPNVLLSAFADNGINLDLGFWIADPELGTGTVRSEVSLALWKSFREQGVEIPFPQREIRVLSALSVLDDTAQALQPTQTNASAQQNSTTTGQKVSDPQ